MNRGKSSNPAGLISAPPLASTNTEKLYWSGLNGSAQGYAITRAAHQHSGLLMVITPDTPSAIALELDCRFFAPDLTVLAFPDWETLAYDRFSPHQDIISERLKTLKQLQKGQPGVLIIPVASLMQRIAPTQFLTQFGLVLEAGDAFNIKTVRQDLETAGYHHVEQVASHGEYTSRGSIFDIFPMGSHVPYRLDLFDDEIDSIRTFDPDTQRSIDKLDAIEVLPAREFPLTDAAIARFKDQWRDHFTGQPRQYVMYESVVEKRPAAGVEYFLPLFFQSTATLFDYLPENALVIFSDKIERAAEQVNQEVKDRYEQLSGNREFPILPPDELFMPVNELFQKLKNTLRIEIINDKTVRDYAIDFATLPPPDLSASQDTSAQKKQSVLIENITSFAQQHSRILWVAESAGRREILNELLRKAHLSPKTVEGFSAFIKAQDTACITVGSLTHGLCVNDPQLTIITEAQLFGDQVRQTRLRRKKQQDPDAVIHHLAELRPGAPVVHIDHGVGRYTGLQTLDIAGQTGEFVTLEYAGQDKLYVPINALELISHYTGVEADQAPLHKLGNAKWAKDVEKAAKKVSDVAAELLDIYAKREANPGIHHQLPDEYPAFADQFAFEETPDQARAITSVIEDMVSDKRMDRLVCGDVGFGKTEVALRAAFISAMNNKQVAILVPTTLLAEQHYQTFSDRFADWPVRIEVLSRFKSGKKQTQILHDLAAGKIDIIVGTHKLLGEKISFKKLGLLVIDEEHRFGVKQKEAIKKFRTEIDILTLTATPIPRTLNMAMSGVRDLSLIATPPQKRLSIKTFKRNYDPGVIREAILREQHRGGQVYFLHNDVKTIEDKAARIQELVPEAKINLAHGQMPEHQLERIMSDFYHQRFNVLVCTTIIETGIDIPTANTIIMNNADKLGLAQMHQLRGRVGRSHHQAYAYLLIDPDRKLTKNAEKRLDAICEFEELGVGFHLASHDLEIRGAGELLGQEQSGQIEAIGFSLYMEFLDKAVAALKSGETINWDKPLETGPEVNCRVTALIPDTVIADPHLRLVQYKKIANAKTFDELESLKVEYIDRFGLMQPPTKNLFKVTELKLTAQQLGIEKIEANTRYAKLFFPKTPKVDPDKIIRLIQKAPMTYKLEAGQNLKITQTMPEEIDRLNGVEAVLNQLM